MPKAIAEEATKTDAQVILEALSAEFEQTYTRSVGGRNLTYISGEQAISRLNEVLGFNWSWKAEANGVNAEAEEVWVRGVLTVKLPTGEVAERSGSGGAKIKKMRDGRYMDLGNDTKAAETDALKKAAMKFGVGLYLSKRNPNDEVERDEFVAGNSGPSYPKATSSGNSTTGVIDRISPNGVQIGGTWFNISKFSTAFTGDDLKSLKQGQMVTIEHAPNKTFIDNVVVGGGEAVAAGVKDDLEDLPF